MTSPITAESSPRYDGWGPDNPWTGDEWIAWHRALEARFGTAEADRRWALAWLAGLSVAGGGVGTARGAGLVFDAVPVGERTTNPAFYAYVVPRPTLYRVVFAGPGGAVAAPVAGGAAVARGAAATLRDTSALVGQAGHVFESVGPLALLGLFFAIRRRS